MTLTSRLWRAAPVLLCLAVLFWAGNSIAGRLMAGVVPPMALSFWRWVLATALITPFALPHLKADWPELKRRWPMVLALSASGVASFGALLYLGLETTTALNSLLMQAAIPPLILLFGVLFLRERTAWAQVLGVALSLLGVLVVIAQGRPWDLLHLDLHPGDGLVLVGVLLYAGYSLLLRDKPKVHPFSLLWATFVLSILLLAPLYGWELSRGRTFSPTPAALAGLAYVAVFPSFLAYLFFNRGVELLGPARGAHFMHLMPVFGSVLAVFLLGEAFKGFHAVGVALIAAGILLASVKKPSSRAG
ncbi:MAG: DMT family transporter [Caulobacter sp.]|jgi:drug/metabolite transporter (DMT)-like permease|nr:DMT family transporter [Caulobacter sp.]